MPGHLDTFPKFRVEAQVRPGLRREAVEESGPSSAAITLAEAATSKPSDATTPELVPSDCDPYRLTAW